jgi:hypothetical protein
MGWEFAGQQLRQLGAPRKRNEDPLHNGPKSPDDEQQTEQSSILGPILESLRGVNNTRHCGSKMNDEFGFSIGIRAGRESI